MSDHENYCGSRTERCDRCPDWVQLREWDSHQNRYHSNMQRRFRERSVIAQTETIIDYNASKIQSEESTNDPMLPCEFCDGLVPMRKLLEHQVQKKTADDSIESFHTQSLGSFVCQKHKSCPQKKWENTFQTLPFHSFYVVFCSNAKIGTQLSKILTSQCMKNILKSLSFYNIASKAS